MSRPPFHARICPRCGFTTSHNIETVVCPKDGANLRRMTWTEYAEHLNDMLDSFAQENLNLMEDYDRLTKWSALWKAMAKRWRRRLKFLMRLTRLTAREGEKYKRYLEKEE